MPTPTIAGRARRRHDDAMSDEEAVTEPTVLELHRTESPRGLRIAGEIDLSNVHEVGDALRREAEQPGELTLDLTGCRYIGSEGIAALIQTWQRVREAGKLTVVAGAGTVRRVLEMSGLQKFPNLEIVDPPEGRA